MRKLVLGLSVAQILPEKINKILSPNNPGLIDVNPTVPPPKEFPIVCPITMPCLTLSKRIFYGLEMLLKKALLRIYKMGITPVDGPHIPLQLFFLIVH